MGYPHSPFRLFLASMGSSTTKYYCENLLTLPPDEEKGSTEDERNVRVCEVSGIFLPLYYPQLPLATLPHLTRPFTPPYGYGHTFLFSTGLHQNASGCTQLHALYSAHTLHLPFLLHYIPPFITVLCCLHNHLHHHHNHPLHHTTQPPSATSHHPLPTSSSINHLPSPITSINPSFLLNQLNSHS